MSKQEGNILAGAGRGGQGQRSEQGTMIPARRHIGSETIGPVTERYGEILATCQRRAITVVLLEQNRGDLVQMKPFVPVLMAARRLTGR